MQFKRIHQHIVLIGSIMILLGLAGSFGLLLKNAPNTMELPNAFLNSHLISLYLQPAILALFYSQVLTFRRINLFVGVRQTTNLMITRLLGLATIYCGLFLLGLFIPYFLSGYTLFKYGNPVLGTAIIALHISVLLFMFWLLVGAYDLPHPYVLLVAVLILDLVYHYYIEKRLLIYYSPMYDEFYRTIHHIYGGF